ncbi:hypothetical protein [Mucilaginibacter sp.]|uniref:hypothetical protein n=1 Tax=Mucilaginibacter sp. TaxID=1882438 RepID=UPI00284959AD|nr:hypothetical protein [Mucilaginibacter sp.]MDR3695652.1 hypothetical protein [Mucilaginibacter sp.]
MENNIYLRVLGFLYNQRSVHEYVDVSHIFNDCYTKQDINHLLGKIPRTDKINKDLAIIQNDGYILFIDLCPTDYNKYPYVKPICFKACITAGGIQFYSTHLLAVKTLRNFRISVIISIIALSLTLTSIVYTIYTHSDYKDLETHPKSLQQPQGSLKSIKHTQQGNNPTFHDANKQ